MQTSKPFRSYRLIGALLPLILAGGILPALGQEVPPTTLATGGRLRINQTQCLTRAADAIRAASLTLNRPDSQGSRGGYNRFSSAIIFCESADGGVIWIVSVAGLPGYNPQTVNIRDSLGAFMRGERAAATFAGEWSTASQGFPADMTLSQDQRGVVSGRYVGNGFSGTIRGQVDPQDGILYYSFTQSDGRTGSGHFVLGDGGNSIDGFWSYTTNPRDRSGGQWTGRRK